MKIRYETKRPGMYRSMKYWGKKPHNIWFDLIKEHTSMGDVVYDPFAGSSITFFEAIRADRNVICADINPLSTFVVDIYSKKYDFEEVQKISNMLQKTVTEHLVYKNNYVTECSQCKSKIPVYNYIWHDGLIIESRAKCNICSKLVINNLHELKANEFLEDLDIWIPTHDMSTFHSISENTLKKFGGVEISNLWTDRNLQLNAILFKEIKKLKEPYRKLFVFAFIQSLHLTSKMCAVRGVHANRPLSTSWGRPAFMALTKSMEQNPIIQFERALNGNSGLINALKSSNDYVGVYEYSNSLKSKSDDPFINRSLLADSKKINNFEVDFIITDPPYGNIIQYNELSMIWNVWLENAYPDLKTNNKEEIIINQGSNRSIYEKNLSQVFENCYKMLKEEGIMIFTYNTNDYEDWLSIEKIIDSSGFEIVKFEHQKNLRSSEANVSAKKGTGISDFYIYLRKNKKGIDPRSNNSKVFENFRGELKNDRKKR